MYLMVDNYDSFVYNLARYLEELGQEVLLVRNDRITADQIESFLEEGKLQGIILSPGPKSPRDCGNCREIVDKMAGRVPILGICLGHQIIGYHYGARVQKGERPMHGKVTPITHNGHGIFEGLPSTYKVTRYHSLVVREEELPSVLQIDARAGDGAVMGISHKYLPVYGAQFHPEAVLTEYGYELLDNYTKICERWWRDHEDNYPKAAVL